MYHLPVPVHTPEAPKGDTRPTGRSVSFALCSAGGRGRVRGGGDMSDRSGPPGAGDPAPRFVLPGSDGRTHDLDDYVRRQAVVLAWFPKAYTPG